MTRYHRFMFTATLLVFMSYSTKAQHHPTQKDIVTSEIDFAKQARQKGNKYAFERNLDSTGMTVNGIRIVNGLSAYANGRHDTTDLLTWYPRYAWVNKGGDFGFTTGPYLYFAKRDADPVASGHYFSIWKKGDENIFKIIFDGGVNHAHIKKDYDVTQANTLSVKAGLLKVGSDEKNQVPPEVKTSSDIAQYLDNQVVILRADLPIVLGRKNYQPLPTEMVYVPKKNGYDRSGKLFYCFGNLSKNMEEAKAGKFKGYYAQVWRFEKKWKIVADVTQLAN